MHACSDAHLYLTLCDPMNCRPPGSPVHGIFLARILEGLPFPPRGAIPDPGVSHLIHCIVNIKWKCWLLSRAWLFVTPWTVARQTPLCMEFSRILEWVAIPLSRGSSQPRDLFLFLAVLGLRCYVSFSVAMVSRGYSLLPCAGFSLQGLLVLQDTGSRAHELSNCSSWALEHRLNSYGAWALVAPQHVGSSQIRNRTCVSYTGRQILYRWATREVL